MTVAAATWPPACTRPSSRRSWSTSTRRTSWSKRRSGCSRIGAPRWAAIFGFLGVAPEVDRPEYGRVWERSEGKGRAYRFAWHVAQRMQRHGIHLPDSLRWPAQRVLRSRLLGGGKPIPRPEVPEAVRAELSPLLADEAQRLRALTGLELDDWSV